MEPTNELDAKRTEGLEELAKIELSEIIATANEHCFSAKEVLDALSVAVAEAREALLEDPDPAEIHRQLWPLSRDLTPGHRG